jgi:exopolyphosphatase/pppGpp-phosphohydrolase
LAVQAASPDTAAVAQLQQQQQQELLLAAELILSAHMNHTEAVYRAYKQQHQHSHQSEQQQQSQQPPGMTQPVVIGTGGTITTLAALQLQLPAYDHVCVHMSRLTQADVQGLLQQLLLEGGQNR